MFNIKIGTISSKIHTPYEGMYQGGGTQEDKVVTGNGYVDLTKAVANKLIYLKLFGGTEQRNLPAGYTQLEYVVFDSTQVIDTGFTPDNNSRIESKCYRTGAECWFYGASPTNPRVTLYHSSTGTSRWGNQSISSIGFAADTEYTLIEDKNGLTINGVLNAWASGTAGDFTCDRSLTIGNNNGSSGTRYFAGNFYYMKIYNNDVLVRNFVPCKNASNVVGLYDTVNDVFYTAAGLVEGTTVIPTPEAPMDIVCNNGKLVFRDTELPEGYKRILGMTMNNDCFYQTSVYPTGADTLKFSYEWTSSTACNVLGCYTTSSAQDNLSLYIGSSPSSKYLRYDGGTASSYSIADKRYDVQITPTGSIGMETDDTWEQKTFTCSVPLCIGITGASATSAKFIGNLYGNVELVGKVKFIPCERLSDNEIGYYDTLNETFIVPTGTTPTSLGYDYTNYKIVVDGTIETVEDELSNTATAEMLLKVGDYQDGQEILSGDITRNIGIKVLDGTETGWTKLSGVNYVSLPKTEISNIVSGTDATCLSNYFIQVPHGSISTVEECFSVGASYINFKKAGDPTAAQFKQWLTDQYNAGTPVIVLYPLATPTTESVSGQTLNVKSGTNRIEITQASINNLGIEAKYTARQ